MNSRHKKTLTAIFRHPTPATVNWKAIETLFIAVGCRTIEGSGSRVRFIHGNEIATFHRPHPDKVAKRYQVREARDFLVRIGVKQ